MRLLLTAFFLAAALAAQLTAGAPAQAGVRAAGGKGQWAPRSVPIILSRFLRSSCVTCLCAKPCGADVQHLPCACAPCSEDMRQVE